MLQLQQAGSNVWHSLWGRGFLNRDTWTLEDLAIKQSVFVVPTGGETQQTVTIKLRWWKYPRFMESHLIQTFGGTSLDRISKSLRGGVESRTVEIIRGSSDRSIRVILVSTDELNELIPVLKPAHCERRARVCLSPDGR